jgi:hypothetical protein
MTPDGTPDHQLHQFLTAARARLCPEDIGIRPAATQRLAASRYEAISLSI